MIQHLSKVRVFKVLTKPCPGFTLAELLVVIGIIVLLTTLSTVSYKAHQKGNALRLATQELVSNLNYVRNLTLSGKKITEDCTDEGCSWYGIHFVSNSYYLYVDKNGGGDYTGTENEKIKEIKLPGGVTVENPPSDLEFKYIAGGAIKIEVINCGDTARSITLSDDAQKKIIEVNCATGRINVQD